MQIPSLTESVGRWVVYYSASELAHRVYFEHIIFIWNKVVKNANKCGHGYIAKNISQNANAENDRSKQAKQQIKLQTIAAQTHEPHQIDIVGSAAIWHLVQINRFMSK